LKPIGTKDLRINVKMESGLNFQDKILMHLKEESLCKNFPTRNSRQQFFALLI
jgi:hypothetical protein